MRALLIVLACMILPVKAEAPTDARLMCGTLVGKGAIHIPRPDGKFSLYVIECEFKGLSA